MFDVIGPYARNPSLALAAAKLWRLGVGRNLVPINHSRHAGYLMGLPVKNPIGLAAGIDRTGCLLNGTAKAGYGFSEVGSVTPRTLQRTLLNLNQARKIDIDITVGVNIRTTPSATEEMTITHYLTCLQRLFPVADYIVLNLTAFYSHERDFDNLAWLARLLLSARHERKSYQNKSGKRIPLAVKLPLSLGVSGLQSRSLELCRQVGMDGVFVVSPACQDDDHICELLKSAKAIVNSMDLVSVGGVATTDHVVTRLEAGAAAVQVFSSVLKRGTFVPRYLLKNLQSSQSALVV